MFLIAPAALADKGGSALVQPDYYSDVASLFAKTFPGEHLIPQPLDDSVSSRSWTNYLQSLDYEHLYFLSSDVQSLSRDKTLLDNRLSEGNLSFAYDVYEIFLQRVRERFAHVEKAYSLPLQKRSQSIPSVRAAPQPLHRASHARMDNSATTSASRQGCA